VIQAALKMLSIVLAVSLSNCAFSRGANPPRDIKIYDFENNAEWCNAEWCAGKYGFIRSQSREVVNIWSRKANTMIGMTEDDFQRLLEACPR